MEEKKQKTEKKLSYEELSQAASDLHVQYQKAVNYIQQLQDRLDQQAFSKTAFLLESMFKVMDHIELYDDDFATWAKNNIQGAIVSLYDEMTPPEKEESKQTENKETKNAS